jgi:hypothetical protein
MSEQTRAEAGQATVAEVDALTQTDRAWLVRDEARWRRAREIAADYPGMDVSGVYHVLRNLEKTPTERLRAALVNGRSGTAR